MMVTYLGVKLIQAQPMKRGEYNSLRGWVVPEDENADDEGYLVEYLDGGKANHKDFTGYISWSPKDVFERAYRPTFGLNFGLALEALKQGQRLARAGWNGKDMWIGYVHPHSYDIFSIAFPSAMDLLPFIAMKTADDKVVPWLASQTDLLAEDWMVL